MSSKEKTKANWADPGTTAENEVLPKHLKWAWTSRGVSLGIYAIFIGQITYYCTDMLGMSPILLGNLLLVSKIFDGITDLLAGYLVDKTHTKYGKARPYEFAIIFVWLFTVFLFSVPELSMTGKAVYVFVLYTIINSIFVTLLNCNESVYLARGFRSENNRVSVMSFNGVMCMVVAIVASTILPQLVATIGATKSGWTIIALLFAVPMGAIGIFRFVFVKEVITEEIKKEEKQKIPLTIILKCLLKNKYVFILAGINFIFNVINTGSAAGTYYFKYIVGDIGLMSFVSMGSLTSVVVIALFPKLFGKFGAVNVARIGAVTSIIGYVMRIIGGTNIVTLIVGSTLGTLGVLPVGLMMGIYIIECMDYGEWKTGVRIEGMLNSVTSFSSKVGVAVSSWLVGVVMGATGYDGLLEVQSSQAIGGIVALYNYIPLALSVVMLLLSIAYNIDKFMPQVHADLAAKKTSKYHGR